MVGMEKVVVAAERAAIVELVDELVDTCWDGLRDRERGIVENGCRWAGL